MVFSSTIFLFLFLPIIILGNFLLNQKHRNTFLFIGSLLFYFWGEKSLTIIMLCSILINYFSGIGIAYLQKQKRVSKTTINISYNSKPIFSAYTINILIFFLTTYPTLGLSQHLKILKLFCQSVFHFSPFKVFPI